MGNVYRYVGGFIPFGEFQDKIAGLGKRLEVLIENPHITFEYRPETVDESLFGKSIFGIIVGYCNDGENEGVKVELSSPEPRIQKMIEQLEVPHITLSVSEAGEAVNTRYLDFKPVEEIPFVAKYGGVVESGRVITDVTEDSLEKIQNVKRR